jgi:hypothetical protein
MKLAPGVSVYQAGGYRWAKRWNSGTKVFARPIAAR